MTLRSGERTVVKVDVARAESGTTGTTPLADLALETNVADLDRCSVAKLRLEGALADQRISGCFLAGDQEGFAAALEVILR